MFLFGFIFYYFFHLAHKMDLEQWSAEVQQRHMETLDREREHKQKWDEINAIAHAKIGTDEYRELMRRLNERDAQKFGTTD